MVNEQRYEKQCNEKPYEKRHNEEQYEKPCIRPLDDVDDRKQSLPKSWLEWDRS